MRRLLGLLLIIRALAPFIAIVVIVLGALQIAGDFHAWVDQPLANLQSDLDRLGTTIDSARRQFETAQAAAGQTIAVTAQALQSIQLPTVTRDQLGALFGVLADDINAIFRGVESVFKPLGEAFGSLDLLGDAIDTVRQSVDETFRQGSVLVSNIQAVMTKWGGLLIVAVVIILALVAVYVGTPLIDDFTRGWRMLLRASKSSS
jgi:hypothetical protein